MATARGAAWAPAPQPPFPAPHFIFSRFGHGLSLGEVRERREAVLESGGKVGQAGAGRAPGDKASERLITCGRDRIHDREEAAIRDCATRDKPPSQLIKAGGRRRRCHPGARGPAGGTWEKVKLSAGGSRPSPPSPLAGEPGAERTPLQPALLRAGPGAAKEAGTAVRGVAQLPCFDAALSTEEALITK